jgi:hypothetical protein
VLSLVLSFCALPAASKDRPRAEFPAVPFWQKKTSALKKMEDERAIFVSVHTERQKPEPPEEAQHRLKILGAGWVNKPRSVSLARMQDYAKWSEIHTYIKAATYTAETKRLYLHMEAFGYEAKMIMTTSLQVQKSTDVLHFFVEEGTFKGMRAAIRFQDARSRKTEIALAAQYDYKHLPLPLFFVEFGLEVVFQKIAEKMRTYIETSQVGS